MPPSKKRRTSKLKSTSPASHSVVNSTSLNSEATSSQPGRSTPSRHQDHDLTANTALDQPENVRSTRMTTRQQQQHQLEQTPSSIDTNVPESADQASASTPNTPSSTSDTASNRQRQKSVDKATSDAVILWIRENYEYMQNCNVPRSGIYEHYRFYCERRQVKPVNAATFGKLIRHTFPGIQTRRLGIRGESKYQYCNIRRREIQGATSSSRDTLQQSHLSAGSDTSHLPTHSPIGPSGNNVEMTQTPGEAPITTAATEPLGSHQQQLHQHQQQQGFSSSSLLQYHQQAHSSTHGLPQFRLPPPLARLPYAPNQASASPSRQSISLPSLDIPESTSTSSSASSSTSSYRPGNRSDVSQLSNQFKNYYNQHCVDIINAICNDQFDKIQPIYENFYIEMPNHFRSLLKHDPELTDSIWRWDCALYDSLITKILPRVDTRLTDNRMSGLRQYTRHLPVFLDQLLAEYPTALRQKKVDVSNIFVAKLRRHLTLNQFATAADHVLRQPLLLAMMKNEWSELDTGVILDHVLWVCDCRNDEMRKILEQEIGGLLTPGTNLKQWMCWMEQLVDHYVPANPKLSGLPDVEKYLNTGKQFILKWKIYSGLIMQQFYIKKSSMAEHFKTLQFFADDLVLYYVEESIARMNADINQFFDTQRATTVNSPSHHVSSITGTDH